MALGTTTTTTTLSGPRPLVQEYPKRDQIGMPTSVEDEVVTIMVTLLLSVMFLAYFCLCCHVWGLHVRIFHIVRSIATNQDGNRSSRNGRRTSIFVTMPGGYSGNYLTPPPRYSATNVSLPSYSCALQRMLKLVNGPVHLRFLVYVESSFENDSVFSGHTPSPTAEDDVPTVNGLTPSVIVNIEDMISDSPGSSENVNSIALHPMASYNSPEASTSSGHTPKSNINGESSTSATPIGSENRFLPAILVTSCSPPVHSPTAVFTPEVGESHNGNTAHPHSDGLSFTRSQESSSSTSPVGTVQPNTTNRASVQSWRVCIPRNTLSRSDVVDAPIIYSDVSPESNQERSPENSIRLLMKGLHGSEEQELYALKCGPNCYAASWPIPSKDHIDSKGLEVFVDGYPVEDIYLEFLNEALQSIGIAQLLPSPARSTLQTSYPSRVPASPSQQTSFRATPSDTSSATNAAITLSAPPPYSPRRI